MHPGAAKELGIAEGDRVVIKSPTGKGKLRVTLKNGIRKDTVYMASGYGSLSRGLTRIYGKGASTAELIEDYADELSGNMAMHETFVEISKGGNP